eukprot:CAMPEP_0177612248 /NCGR_PEP_ID=MMETSP0419_2-20121207/21088_1 /TAXON_ID=582737 /ORGANISM="Tetraselmis sp., Strain GSL018" /LENGTH=73 /DNA_ID=CAMNT_0019108361 /DNA_START=129 /DNA_END=346 /DNA_ORIENTATION=-
MSHVNESDSSFGSEEAALWEGSETVDDATRGTNAGRRKNRKKKKRRESRASDAGGPRGFASTWAPSTRVRTAP